MSDISIPGVSNTYNSDKIVEDLMRLERIPLNRLEEQLKGYEFQRQNWRDLNRSFVGFRDTARNLYSFQNPFNNRIAESSDTYYLTARATREAPEGSTEIEIEQIAKADRLLSAPLEDGYTVPEGNYVFKVGDQEISVRFRGGNLRSFADTINSRGNNLIRASVVRNTATSQVLSIEAVKTGTENRLFFMGDSVPLALSMGIIKENQSDSIRFAPEVRDFRSWDKPLGSGALKAAGGTSQGASPGASQGTQEPAQGVVFSPGSEAKIPFNLGESQTAPLFLEFTVNVKNLREDQREASLPPPGPAIPATGGISYEDLQVHSESSQVELPQWTPPQPPPRNDDLSVFFLQDASRLVPLPAINAEDGGQTYRVELSDYVDSLSSLNIRNNNTHREITISDVRVFDPASRGDHLPANPISTAQDSVIRVDGIPITRSSNELDDVIPGVTLTLRRPSRDVLTLDVGPDREAVKEALINFVGTYNRLLAEINILTSSDPAVIDQIEYFSREERDEAAERLGLYQGDSTLNQVKSRFQRIMMDPYPTSREEHLSLLAQIGISTNAIGGGYDSSRRGGYLEINEDTLDSRLESDFQAVKELFGSDSDGDLVVDRGLAFQMDTYLRAYVETGGILANRMSTLDSRISRTNTDITNYKVKLENTEAELKRKYGLMEGTLQGLQNSTQSLNNLNSLNNNNNR